METAKRRITALLALVLLALVWLGLLLPAQASASANSPGIILGGGAVTKGNTIVMAGTNWDVVLNSTSTDSANGRLLMTSEKIGTDQITMFYWDGMSYIDTFYDNNFTDLEKAAVMSTSKIDPEGTYADIYFDDSILIDRKLFALSVSEATSYFDSDAGRLPGGWWLRSLFYGNNFAGIVNVDGALGIVAPYDDNINFVRPAFNLNLSSVLFSSAAVGGKSISPGYGQSPYVDGVATISEIPSNTTNMWKLTLRDSSRGFTATPAASDALTAAYGYDDWRIHISYDGAKRGFNEYVSTLLCDAHGRALYYGHLTKNSVSGTVELALPDGLGVGTYTLRVFSEQCNGNNKTDYGSAFANIGLTVTGESHTVTFDTDQHGVTPVAQTVGHGSRAADPGPQSADEMNLVGWQYLPEGYKERINFDFDTPITADTTLFAKWEQRLQLIVNASGLNCGSFTITGSDGVVYAQNRSVNTLLPAGITVTLTISPDENCTFSGSYQFHRSTIETALSSSLTTYDLYDGNVTVDLVFEKLPVLTMKVTSPEESSGWWAVTDGASTPNNYTNGSPIPISTGEISIAADWLTLTITPPEGIGCDGSIDNNGAITTVADGKTVYSGIDAKGPVTITLNFYARSAFHTICFYNGNTPISSQQVAVSEDPGQPATAKLNPYTNTSGKIFRGWNTVAAPTAENPGTFYADNAEISLTGDINLYAQWTDAYAVTFDKNNGEGSMDKFRLPKNDATGNLPACAFTRSGYAFSGWNTKANGLGDSYTDGQQVTLTKSSLTLYAQWATAWTISFHPNDGEGTMADIAVARGQTAALPACAFTREGYDFAGWAVSANGEKVYDDQTSVTPTDNCTFYALWTPHVYAISYELDGGALPQGVTNPDNYTIETPTICLHEPVKEDFSFDGWYTDAGLTRSATGIGQGSTGDKTFYAKWSETVIPVFGPATFTLPADVTTVGAEAFEGASMSVVYIHDGCTAIGDHAFRNCMNLWQIRIPADCTLGTDVFDQCNLLYIYGTVGSSAETYCSSHANCVFVEEAMD